MTIVVGIANVLDEIKTRGWDAVQDDNGEVTLVDDITLDPNTDDLEGEYLIDGDQVIRLRNGIMAERIWVEQ